MSIVLGFIDTLQGWAAAEYAIAEAKLHGARVVVVNSMRGGSHDEGEDYLAIGTAIEKLRARLAEEGVEFDVHEYVRGMTPSEDLVAASKEFEADLIVIGLRRRSTTGKVLLGSNALEILHDSDVPVVCVKAAEPGQPG